jgi:hypothetical protein
MSRRHLARDLQGVVERQLLLPVQPVAQRLALDVGHDIETKPVGNARVVQRQDVGMGESRGEPDLPEEPRGAEGGGQLPAQDLQGDGAVVLPVLAQPDRGHAATPDLTLDRVAAPQRLGNAVRRLRHPAPRNAGSRRPYDTAGNRRKPGGTGLAPLGTR